MGRQDSDASHRDPLPSIAVVARLVLPSLAAILKALGQGLEQIGRLDHKAVLTVSFPVEPHVLALRCGDGRRRCLLICLRILQQPVQAVATPLEPEKG